MLMDKDGSEENGNHDGAEDPKDPAADTSVPEQGAEQDPNAGAEAGEVEAGGEGDGSEAANEGAEGTDLSPNSVEALHKQVADLTARLETLSKPREEAPAPVPQPTEEQWQAKADELGVSVKYLKFETTQKANLYNRIKQEIISEMTGRFSKFEKADAISSLSKDPQFADAPKYRKDIDTFLEKFDAKEQSNPELLKMAVIYARGLNAKKREAGIRSDGERNRHINGAARPASSSSGTRSKVTPLFGNQKVVAAMMNGDAEYNKFRGRRTFE